MQATDLEHSLFPDEAHVRAIAMALWRRRERGAAAVMIGAGFSANSIYLGTGTIPLWAGLVNEMHRQLHELEPGYKSGDGGMNSLRIAEEYQAAFGRPALDRLIAENIADARFEPGPLHRRLLDLPWADVFTTNWDTLLERSAGQVLDRSYDVVRTTAEIPRSAAPRIVKLHGSLPSNAPFILTEEDFRTYPSRFAPFVNLAQQSMTENVFCLLGFSGDDPNFLYWSGWVRDHLGPSAPRIYLVGWLGLTQARRKMLEDRNVIPVDLSKLKPAVAWPKEARHSLSIEWFLRSLRMAEPPRALLWPDTGPRSIWPARLPPGAYTSSSAVRVDVAETDALKIGLSWHSERQRYPGWLIAPASVREMAWLYTQRHLNAVLQGLDELQPISKLFVLSELNWRFDLCLTPLPNEIKAVFEGVLDNPELSTGDPADAGRLPQTWMQPRAWLELALACLRQSREQGDLPATNLWAAKLASRTAVDQVAESFVKYELCLGALERLDHPAVEALVSGWTNAAPDPIWSVRKAAVLAELGMITAAKALITSALMETRRRTRKDIDDLAFLSREGWALDLLQGIRWAAIGDRDDDDIEEPDFWDRMFRLSQLECSPGPRMEETENSFAGGPAKLPGRRERVAFDAGTTVVSTSIFGSSPWLSALPGLRARRMLELGAVPPFIANSMVGKGLLLKAAAYLSKLMPQVALSVALRCSGSADDDAFDEMFSRATIARTGEAEASGLLDRIQGSMALAASRLRSGSRVGDLESQHAIRQLVAAIQLLSRFCLRVPEKAVSVFTVAAGYCREEGFRIHPWVSAEVMKLVNRSVEAMSSAERNAQALQIFNLPLPSGDLFSRSADPCTQMDPKSPPSRTDIADGWAETVVTLTRAAGATGMQRIAAIQRLQIMRQLRLLSPEEETAIGQVLWASVPREFKQPQKLGLPPSTFLHLPEARPGQAVEAFRASMLAGTGVLYRGSTNERFFSALRSAARIGGDGSAARVVLTDEEVELVLRRAESWLATPAGQKHVENIGPFGDIDDAEVPIVNALLEAILPGLQPGSALADHALSLVATMTAKGFRTEVLSHLIVRLKPSTMNDIVENLLVAMNSVDGSRAILAFLSTRFWAAAAPESSVPQLPEALCGQVVTSVCSLRLQPLSAALDAASTLVEKGILPGGTRSEARLLVALETLSGVATYGAGLEDVDPTLSTGEIRAACVRLAFAFKGRGRSAPTLDSWIACAPVDPLPEVRAASRLTCTA